MRSHIPWWWSIGAWGLAIMVTAICLNPQAPHSPLPSDKLDHLLAFAALGVGLACGRRHPTAWIAAVALWGGVIELIQGQIGRSAEWGDWAADSLGASLGYLLLLVPPLCRFHLRWQAVNPDDS